MMTTSKFTDEFENRSQGPLGRALHFAAEKQYLEQAFGEFLMERIKSMDVDKVILFIDAGTTLQPFLEGLGREAENLKKTGKSGGADWIDNIVVVTNNFSGFQTLLDRIPEKDKKDLGAETALRVVLLPGRFLPTYDAIVGFENRFLGETLGKVLTPLKPYRTIQEIRRMVDDHNAEGNSEIKIISLVTGNWIRIRKRPPAIPVPLARGAGHLAIKREMIAAADEVYVISPLGKVFVDHNKAEINQVLRMIANPENTVPQKHDATQPEQPDDDKPAARQSYKHSYKELDTDRLTPHLDITQEIRKDYKIKLVTTYRHPNTVLYAHSERLFKALGGRYSEEDTDATYVRHITGGHHDPLKYQFSVKEIHRIPHLMFEFDPMDPGKYPLARRPASERSREDLRKISLHSESRSEFEKSVTVTARKAGDYWRQMITDFPHSSTRNRKVLEFFYVNEVRDPRHPSKTRRLLEFAFPAEVERARYFKNLIDFIQPFTRFYKASDSPTEFEKRTYELEEMAIDELKKDATSEIEAEKDEFKQAKLIVDLTARELREAEFYDQFQKNPEKNYHLAVIHIGDEIAGWGAFWENKPQAVVSMMYASTKFRRGGIASKVLEEMENRARTLKFTECVLVAEEDRVGSLEFYKHRGYEEMDSLPSDPDKSKRMRKAL